MHSIEFNAVVWKEGDVYVAHCPELDVASCGDTVEEARRMLREAMEIFLDETEHLGTLRDILEEAGFTPIEDGKDRHWIGPFLVVAERVYGNLAT